MPSSHLLRARILLTLSIGALFMIAACGGSSGSVTAPSTQSVVQASITPVATATRLDPAPSASARYQIDATLTFQAGSAISGKITAIDVTVTGASGETGKKTLPVDIPISAGGSASYHLADSLPLVSQEPFRLRVTARGTDSSGAAFEVAAVEAMMMNNRVAPDASVLAAGDIAVCGSSTTEATARLLDRHPGTILPLGDTVYPSGTAEQFTNCYGPTWGRHKSRTSPAPGNHEWEISAGAPYFAYFGAAAGPRGLGYYSFDLGAWHILSLNSNVATDPDSPQYAWVQHDLEASRPQCSLAFWHHPRFSSGSNGNDNRLRELWRLLDAQGVDVVVVGHDHDYERFDPQDADGNPSADGIREFVVGTGGAALNQTKTVQPNSRVRENSSWGVLHLTLRTGGYEWEFLPIEGQSFRDTGSTACRP